MSITVAAITAKALGQRIKVLRMTKGLTQSDLAGEDYSKAYISAIEQGKVRPSLSALQCIASRLQVELAQLVDAQGSSLNAADLDLLSKRVRKRRGESGYIDDEKGRESNSMRHADRSGARPAL